MCGGDAFFLSNYFDHLFYLLIHTDFHRHYCHVGQTAIIFCSQVEFSFFSPAGATIARIKVTSTDQFRGGRNLNFKNFWNNIAPAGAGRICIERFMRNFLLMGGRPIMPPSLRHFGEANKCIC